MPRDGPITDLASGEYAPCFPVEFVMFLASFERRHFRARFPPIAHTLFEICPPAQSEAAHRGWGAMNHSEAWMAVVFVQGLECVAHTFREL
jgi:hypothetical protein